MEMTQIYKPLYDLLKGYTDSRPEEDVLSLLNTDKSTEHYQFSYRFQRFEHHLRDIYLILNRLRNDAGIDHNGERILPFSEFHGMQLDLESFLLFTRITLDDVAGFVPLFFPKKSGQIPTKSFRTQKDWFVKDRGRNIDPEWSNYLGTKTNWFDKLRRRRDDHVHRDLWGYVDYDWRTDKIISKNMNANFEDSEIDDLISYVADLFSRFFEFLRDFEEHFSKVYKDQCPDFDKKHLSASMTEGEWLNTIRFFLRVGSSRVSIDY